MLTGWKTLAFNIALAIVGVLQTFDWVSVVGDSKTGIVMSAIAVVNVVLRYFTNGPVGTKS